MIGNFINHFNLLLQTSLPISWELMAAQGPHLAPELRRPNKEKRPIEAAQTKSFSNISIVNKSIVNEYKQRASLGPGGGEWAMGAHLYKNSAMKLFRHMVPNQYRP